MTVLANDRSAEPGAVTFRRLSLFGPGAARLHDELIAVAAPFRESGDGDHLKPAGAEGDRAIVTHLEDLLTRAARLPPVPEPLAKRLAKTAAGDFATLWRHVREEADGRAHEAGQLLQARGAKEADDLRQILKAQRIEIEGQLSKQLDLFAGVDADAMKQLRDQVESERDDMRKRLARIKEEIMTEPADLESLYRVSLKRLAPIGLVYLWPATAF